MKQLHNCRSWRPWATACAVCVLLTGVAPGVAAQGQVSICGELANGYGPFDYRTDRDKLPIVENSHFTPTVEALIRGISGHVGGELDYLLRAFPNHHRGLLAMTRLGERYKWQRPPGAQYDVECYFDRALRFRPTDTVSRQLFASYLIKRNRREEALAQLKRATVDAGDNALTHHNIGLLYLQMKEYDQALAQAHRARELGFARADLADGLRAAGRWSEPPSTPDAAASAASAASAPQ